MSELFQEGRQDGITDLSDIVHLKTKAMEWQDCGHDGFLVKALFKGEGGLPLTQLMKVEAGAFSDLHGHEEIEQVFVLEGSFYDQHRRYEAGDFLVRPAQSLHTAGSDEGAILLLVYSAA